MNTRQNRLLADHFYLAEASYADFSQAKTGNTSEFVLPASPKIAIFVIGQTNEGRQR